MYTRKSLMFFLLLSMPSQPLIQQGAVFFYFEIWNQFTFQLFLITERKIFSIFFYKKIKRIYDNHVGDHFHFNLQFIGFFRKYNPCLVITKRILLPVDKMILSEIL